MFRSGVSLRTYSRVAWACLVSLYAIIVTGSLVRLTGSGLGCRDWPRCSDQRFVDVSTSHAAIEQINRLFTGVVAFAVIAAVLLSLRLKPRQKSLTWLSVGLVTGVVIQILIGAIVVVSGLHPVFNMAHYLVSIVLITTAFELLFRVRQLQLIPADIADGDRELDEFPRISPGTRRLLRMELLILAGVLFAGTVVTGSGPHAGDETAPRFGFSIQRVTQIHSGVVWIALLIVIVLYVRLRRNLDEWTRLSQNLELLTVILVAQGSLGYFQYFVGVPAGLVAIHVGLSVGVWISALALFNAARLSVN